MDLDPLDQETQPATVIDLDTRRTAFRRSAVGPWRYAGVLERALTDLGLRPRDGRRGSVAADCRDCLGRVLVMRSETPEIRCACGCRAKVSVLIDRRFGLRIWLRGALPEGVAS